MAGQAEPLEPSARGLFRLRRRAVEDLQAEPHIVERRAPGHQPVTLEDDADLAAEEFEFGEGIVADDTGLAGGRTSTNRPSCRVQAMAPAMSTNCCWRSSW